MNRKNFYRQLRKCANQFIWSSKNSKLRGYSDMQYCPITLVAKSMTNERYSINEWDNAAKDIGLSFEDARMIVEAADNDIDCLTGHLKFTRQALERAING